MDKKHKLHLLTDTEIGFVLTSGGGQCRYRFGARPCAPVSLSNQAQGRTLHEPGRVARRHTGAARLVVAMLAAMARLSVEHPG